VQRKAQSREKYFLSTGMSWAVKRGRETHTSGKIISLEIRRALLKELQRIKRI
jgi:hypothetical protein